MKLRYRISSLLALICFLTQFVSMPAQATTLEHRNLAEVNTFLDGWKPVAIDGNKQISFPELMQRLQTKRVVFVGETHDRYDHHMNQLLILRAMHRQDPKIGIGVEWFQQNFQPVINNYLAGKINEDQLLEQTDYYNRWRYDFRMLRPILEYAKAHQLPVIALNAPSELTSKVGMQGLDSLTKAERAQLPDEITPAAGSYLNKLRQVFASHAHGHGQFENFAMVQRIWDETMASNVVKFLLTNEKSRMIVFAGSGHVSAKAAIPNDVSRRLPKISKATIHSVDIRERFNDEVDYQLLTQFLSLPPTGKLGVWLVPAKNGVMIGKLVPDSAADKAGLHEGDKIISINGKSIDTVGELYTCLAKYKPGHKIKLGIKQPNLKGQPPQEVVYTITLQ
ncbi:MAG: PDZ domain-containing protein [Thiothrix sp.]|nr:MAG: PDZ domain-containing protein [Thiothrix sp.]